MGYYIARYLLIAALAVFLYRRYFRAGRRRLFFTAGPVFILLLVASDVLAAVIPGAPVFNILSGALTLLLLGFSAAVPVLARKSGKLK